jgi:hypothetical protein
MKPSRASSGKASPRKASARKATARKANARAAGAGTATLRLPAGDVVLPSLDWLAPLDARARLTTGAATEMVRVPVAVANRLLRTTIRLVADLPPRASGATVWVQGDSELLVDALAVTLTCAPALVTIGVPVTCDQLQMKPTVIPVPIAVGTAERPAGLVMATFDRLAGPDVVTARWSEAIAAFAWEALVHLAQQLSAAVGKDADGRPLVPAGIGAEQGVLLVQPMARHDLSVRITR